MRILQEDVRPADGPLRSFQGVIYLKSLTHIMLTIHLIGKFSSQFFQQVKGKETAHDFSRKKNQFSKLVFQMPGRIDHLNRSFSTNVVHNKM